MAIKKRLDKRRGAISGDEAAYIRPIAGHCFQRLILREVLRRGPCQRVSRNYRSRGRPLLAANDTLPLYFRPSRAQGAFLISSIGR
jgi:hypothetical protein